MISEVKSDQIDKLVLLAHKLWPDESVSGLRKEFLREILLPNFKLYLVSRDQTAIGFIQISIRNDYVEGSILSGPTGYVEGIYIEPEYRRQGIARKLIAAGELWAKGNGCKEMGSDVHINNKDSQSFHESMGFKESNRLVAYIKTL